MYYYDPSWNFRATRVYILDSGINWNHVGYVVLSTAPMKPRMPEISRRQLPNYPSFPRMRAVLTIHHVIRN